MKLFDEKNQSTPWRNKVAADLNTVLARVEYIQSQAMDESDSDFCSAALAIVDRVSEFEEIEGSDPAQQPLAGQGGKG